MLKTKLQARFKTKRLNTNKAPALIAACVVALSLSACGSSEAISDLDDALSELDDAFDGVGDTPVNDDTPGQSADEASQEINNLLFGDEMQELSYKTLEELGPFQDRMYGSDEIFVISNGPSVGTGESANSSLVLDIPFTMEREGTEGLVIEKLYVVRNYIATSGVCSDIEGSCTPDLSNAIPRIYAVVTNLSNVDMCRVRLGDFGLGDNFFATMKQGGTVAVGGQLGVFDSGHQYTERTDTIFHSCITPGASVFAHATFERDRLSEFNVGDDYADIEDIASFIIPELSGAPQTRRVNGSLEPGFVTSSYQFRDNLDEESQFVGNTTNQSSERLEHDDGYGFVLDPETLLPLSHFFLSRTRNREDEDGDYNPGTELGVNFRINNISNVFTGTSNTLFFRQNYSLAEE